MNYLLNPVVEPKKNNDKRKVGQASQLIQGGQNIICPFTDMKNCKIDDDANMKNVDNV